MAEFKVVIADVKSGKTYNRDVSGQDANALIGKRIGDEIDGNFVGLPFYKLKITGGSDKSGIPMRQDLQGGRRKRVLLTEGVGFHPKDEGVREKKTVRGNTINPDIAQINMKIVKHGPKKIEDAFAEKKEKGEAKDAEEEAK